MSPLLFRHIAVEYRSDTTATLDLLTNLPGALTLRQTITLPSSNNLRTVLPAYPLKANTKGYIFDVAALSSLAGYIAIYRVGFYVRTLGRSASDWQWHWVTLPGTQELWTKLDIPIPPTIENWTKLDIPIPPTNETWTKLDIQIPPTNENWSELKIAIPPTSENWHEMKIAVPPTSENWHDMKIPIPPTSEQWTKYKLGDLPQEDEQQRWQDLPMDA